MKDFSTFDNILKFSGKPSEAECSVPPQIECRGERTFKRAFKCQYCFQTVLTRSEEEDEERDYVCDVNYKCDSVVYPRDDYTTNCTVNKEVLCLGEKISKYIYYM